MRKQTIWDLFTSDKLAEFNQFGWVLSGRAWGDEVTVDIAIAPYDKSDPGNETDPVKVYRAGFDVAEKAIQFARERYEIRSLDIRIIDPVGYPIEITLQLSLSKKRETVRYFRCHGCGAGLSDPAEVDAHKRVHGLVTQEDT